MCPFYRTPFFIIFICGWCKSHPKKSNKLCVPPTAIAVSVPLNRKGIKYRKEANITQAELSERVGVSHEFIRRIESPKGAKTFSVDTLYKISIALNINIGQLFEFDN